MSTIKDFLRQYGKAFVDATVNTPIFPSVKAAQAILETGAGQHIVGNNLFGIKANGKPSDYWKGNAISAETGEVIKGKAETITAGFRAYQDTADSIKDHSQFLFDNPRYKAVLTATSPEEQADALQAAGYATDPEYSKKLKSIINQNDIKKLDEKKKIMKNKMRKKES